MHAQAHTFICACSANLLLETLAAVSEPPDKESRFRVKSFAHLLNSKYFFFKNCIPLIDLRVETLSIYKIEYVYKRIKVVKSREVLKGQFQRLGTTKLDHSREKKKYNNTVDLLH